MKQESSNYSSVVDQKINDTANYYLDWLFTTQFNNINSKETVSELVKWIKLLLEDINNLPDEIKFTESKK